MGFQLGGLSSITLKSLFTYYLNHRVLLPLQQQLPQEFMDLPLLLLLLLQVAVKRQRTIQLLVVAVLLLPVVQCYFTTRLLPKMRVVSDNLFSGFIPNVNVDLFKKLWDQTGSSTPLYRSTLDVSRSSFKTRGPLNISKETMKGRKVESLPLPRIPPRMNKLLV